MSPIATIVATSDEPPELTNGSARPFVGAEHVTTAMFTAACMPIISVSPNTSSDENRSGARLATLTPYQKSSAKSTTTPVHPTSPSSSPTIEKTKSLLASGRKSSFCWLLPSPTPSVPPEPSARSDWITW